MSFPTYPAYKDSGVEWLGEVPNHWQVFPLKRDLIFLTSGSRGWAEYYSDSGSVFLRIGNLGRNGLSLDLSDIQLVEVPSGSEGERTKVVPGDVLFSITAYLGSVAVVPSDLKEAYVSQHVALARLAGRFLSPRWVGYVALSWVGKKYLESQGYGGTKIQLSLDDVANMVMTVPILVEQDNISCFLDHEIARIDALIAEQQRLIELLKEKRQAVISHAVTKGLNPDAPMKDSGVEWLGQMPAHWVVSQLKFNASKVQTGPFGSQLHAEDYVDGGIPLVNPAHMIDGGIIPDSQVTVDEGTWERLRHHALSVGDIVFARRGELGRCAVVSGENEGWLCGTGSLKVTLNGRLSPAYAYLLVTSKGVVSELSLESKGSTMENLNTETLGRVRLPFPPRDEQQLILDYVHSVFGQFVELINEAEEGIKLMSERRSALISAAVTGKIDVRGWHPPAHNTASIAHSIQ